MATAKKRIVKTTAKKTAKKTGVKKASKPAAKSFATLVRREMSAKLPGYRFIGTGGGSGPLVTFERPVPASASDARGPRSSGARGLVEGVMFQKGLYGASWFRVNFFPSFEGPTAMGVTEHTLSAGDHLGPDVSWKDDSELEAAIVDACARLEAKAKAIFLPYEKQRARYAALFGNLVALYTEWLNTAGKKLPAEAFISDDGNPPKLPAFENFWGWLAKKKLTQGLKGDLETSVWRFWHNGRPMRESDYQDDDYYDCTQCKAFVRRKRGRLVKHKVPGFGIHFAFVCPKH